MNRRSGGKPTPRSRRRAASRAPGAPSHAVASEAARAPRASTTSRRAGWAAVLLVAAVALGVYANSLDGELFYDDSNAIVRNSWVHDGDPFAILTHASWWAQGRGRGWRPLTTLTFAANYALHGLAPIGYHLVNVVLHAGVSVLMLVAFTRVTGSSRTATFAALLFAAHPVHTEAVASVVGRAELIAVSGFFLAWLLFLRADAGAERARAAGRDGWERDGRALTALGTFVFFCALLAKENPLSLIGVLVLADLLYPPAGLDPVAALKRRAPRYASLVAAGAVFVLLRQSMLGAAPPGLDMVSNADRLDNPLMNLPLGERLLTAVKVSGLYGWRLLVPRQLAADYSYDQITRVVSPLDPGFLWGLTLLIAVPVFGWWTRRRAPEIALGLGMLALTFVMVSNLVFQIGTIMAERLLYLPSAGFCLALAGVLVRVTGGTQRERDTYLTGPESGLSKAGDGGRRGANSFEHAGEFRRSPPVAMARLVAPLAVILALYAVRTWTRNPVWRDPLTFFTTMVAEAPRSARSHRELGGVLAERGRFDEARREFERSLAIKPGDPATLYNLGNALIQARRYDEAVDAYTQALAARPDFTDAMVNLGNAESLRGDHHTALAWMRRALVLSPQSASLHMNTANELFHLRAFDEARAEYQAALALAPDSADILVNYGAFLLSTGDLDNAIDAYRRAGDAAPAALVGLSASYRAKGQQAEARATHARAAQLFPNDPAVRQMGEVLRRDGVTESGR